MKADIIETIHDFREKEKEYKETKDEMLFWQDVTDADAYRLATLSGYSRKLHKPYDTYLKEQEMFQNNTDDEDDDNANAWIVPTPHSLDSQRSGVLGEYEKNSEIKVHFDF